ncbi:MAG: molybdopterin-dependent oxidoreductase, partial [Anaerolineae bacterium]
EDVSNTAPMLALALRQAARREPMEIARQLQIHEWDDAGVREATQLRKGPIFVTALHGTRLDEIATGTYQAAPDDLARLGHAVAHVLDPDLPAVPDLDGDVLSLAREISDALSASARPLIVSGTGCGSEALLEAAANVAYALCRRGRAAELCLVVPECNSLGLGLLGGRGLEDAFRAMQEGAVDTVVVLENDLYRRADAASVHEFLAAAQNLIALDHLNNHTTAAAHVTLPVGTFAESEGTLVNNEGRAQRFFKVMEAGGEGQESWRWLRDLMLAAGREEAADWETLDDVLAAMTQALPSLRPVLDAAPPESFRLLGQKVPRQSHRYTGRTAMHADVDVSEPKPPDDPDSPLAFSMEGYEGQPPPALIPRFWAPHWNSIQALNKFQQEVAGALRGGDPGVRLVEPAAEGEARAYFEGIPDAFQPREGEWLVLPIYHVFGSEELSLLTPGIRELSPEPYLALHPQDAAGLQVEAGQDVSIEIDGVRYRLPLKLMPALPRGVAGLPVGLPGLPGSIRPGSGGRIPA